jgi:hypothetical protein
MHLGAVIIGNVSSGDKLEWLRVSLLFLSSLSFLPVLRPCWMGEIEQISKD